MPDDAKYARMREEHERDRAFSDRLVRERERVLDDVPGRHLQWVGLLLAPAAFFLHLQFGYIAVYWSCVHRTELWVHLSGLVSLALAAAGLAAAWVVWQRADALPDDAGGAFPRTRFVGATGLGVSALLTLILFWQWAAVFWITPCL